MKRQCHQITVIILSLLLLSHLKSTKSHTVCIIGSGIGGASVAHFLRRYSSSIQPQVIDRVTIFERNGVVGGRMATVTISGETFEAGASILHPKNHHALNFTKSLNLSVNDPKNTEDTLSLGIWDGHKFVYKTLSSNSKLPIVQRFVSYVNSIIICLRYGFSLYRMNNFVEAMLHKFLRYYEDFESRPIFDSVETMLKWAGLYNLTTRTLGKELVEAGLSPLLIQELVTVITRINYGQSVNISGLAGAVSLAGSGGGLWSVKGGNWQMAAGLIERSDVQLLLNEEIESISHLGDFYELNSTVGKSYSCHVTVVATPLDELNIRFSPGISIPPRKLQHTHATFVRGILNPAYFGLKDVKDIPELVGTIESADVAFSSISILKQHEKDITYKVFSRQELADDLLDQIFSVREETMKINWGAYPHYHAPEKFAPFILDDSHLYYVNAFENAASAMETSAVSAENIARLILSRLIGQADLSSPNLKSNVILSEKHLEFDYLKRINLYRQRVWNCKATGKGNLTYEEALISEKKASERIRNIPSGYVTRVLRDVQYSMLNLRDLVNTIAVKLQGPFTVGAELYGRKDGRLHPCKIVKVLQEDASRTQYEIAWLGSDHEMNGKIIVNADELTGKNPPLSKRFLKSFIKDSTYRSLPWVIHDNLARKHGISTAPPLELKSKISVQDGLVVCNRKRKKIEDKQETEEENKNGLKVYRRRKSGEEISKPSASTTNADGATENPEARNIKYPIDDLLVEPAEEDRLLTERPCPCRDFNVPMDCVGNLLMVWDFCSSYGRLFNLSPFSLEDFENSLCYKDSTPLLIVESYSTLLRLLLNDAGKFSMAIENKKRKSKITLVNWTEYLCDFLETSCTVDFSMHISTIKRGHYGLLDIHVKLASFQELVAQALETDTIRDKLDEFVEERQALSATRRDEALHEGRKRREEKERRKLEASPKKEVKLNEGNYAIPNGDFPQKSNVKVYTRKRNHSSVNSQQNHSSRNSEIEHGDSIYENSKKQKVEPNSVENGNHLSKREIHKLKKNEIKESIEMKSIEQRKEFLEREIEKRFIRTIPLGKDRNYCRYWFFRRDGRIFVEDSDSQQWGYYKTKEELDALIGSLNTKGERERALKKQLQKFYNKICAQLHKRSKEATQREIPEDDALVRRSTRVRAPPRENPALAFLKYENKWKEI
ncbi:hypothetical protein F511_12864 [Dorcoceras hygrometricum]|uniref:Prenylcysteine lyase domain-containing protein n=1 Tax=Dorcoceras hygrometricum TaxID=472368 RepID=A0A2Z7CML0_9LAMI|nr:hypothetical protein F511_12864 [Dorcoceras hygrometricum]